LWLLLIFYVALFLLPGAYLRGEVFEEMKHFLRYKETVTSEQYIGNRKQLEAS